jgi:hypothetical protein
MTTLAEVTKRVIAEYLQVPALHLKAEQVQRLCRIEPAMCQLALDALVAAKFLRLTSHGRYARVTEGCSDTGPQPVPSDGIVTAVDPRRERETLILRQPERRRYRSDAELRAEREERERQWHSRDTGRSGAGIAERV